ncbi:MAG: serine hydrolase domain-containing protein [Acidobacteriota bacterium]
MDFERSTRVSVASQARELCKAALVLGAASLIATTATYAEAAQQPQLRWGGPGCTSRPALKQIVDDAFAAAPAGEFFGNGRGSGAPGYSVALSRQGCGVFRYAVGVRDMTTGRRMTPRVRQHIGSLTKMLNGVVSLRLAAAGAFGPQGLETPIDQFLTAEEITLLTVGNDPQAPRCPADIIALNRTTQVPEPITGLCPDFSQITLRQLLNGNHGLFDFLNEVDRNANGFFDIEEPVLGALLDFLGIPRLTLPPQTETAFDLLAAFGVLAHPNATIGGTDLIDFEVSFGNTGQTLLGIVAQRVSGLTYNQLLALAIPQPPGQPPMLSLTAPALTRPQVARQYLVTSNADLVGLPEDLFGLYPTLEIAGNPAIDVYDLGPFIGTNGGGGAGSVVATPNSYRRFFARLISGRLLNATEQQLFDSSFVTVAGLPGVEHGFGVFRFDDPAFGPGFAKSGRVTGSVCQFLHFERGTTTVVACRNSFDAFLRGTVPTSATPVADLARTLVGAVQDP